MCIRDRDAQNLKSPFKKAINGYITTVTKLRHSEDLAQIETLSDEADKKRILVAKHITKEFERLLRAIVDNTPVPPVAAPRRSKRAAPVAAPRSSKRANTSAI